MKIRNKLLLVVLPLALLPMLGVGVIVGYVSKQQAYLGITEATRTDLEHMTQFTLDLLNAHHQQFEVYKKDKQQTIRRDLATLAQFAYNLAALQHDQVIGGQDTLEAAQQEVRKALKSVSVGETGYLYAMTVTGDLTIHIAQEGENIRDAQDENGRYFIREIIENAVGVEEGEVLFTVYPWRNPALGETRARNKIVAYRYFKPWGWIIAAGGYLEETYEDLTFEKQAFAQLKQNLLNKVVGKTGYIYAMTTQGELTIHPFQEGRNLFDEQDHQGRFFIREMCEKKTGWIRYPWQNETDRLPRVKIVRYAYFAPWDWIVAVGSYEDEFYEPANTIGRHILLNVALLTLVVGSLAGLLVVFAAKRLTDPIERMIAGVREVRRGRLDARLAVTGSDELSELAANFNRMTEVLRQNKELEVSLAQHNKMAALGVLSAEVAHEINNPLGVILGYAGYLEGKLDASDPSRKMIQEIKRESKRCKNIVQDLLSYARIPKPVLEETDLKVLLEQIVDFAAHHTVLESIQVVEAIDPELPTVWVDGDQIRQVVMNLLLNAGAAMTEGGRLVASAAADGEGWVKLTVEDSGCGIPEALLEKIFEPFFTTKARGTGLGLAITRTIVEQHGGRIDVTSRVGQGTTVTVRLPMHREEG
jgi:two-component system NtrC family sensor kinase